MDDARQTRLRAAADAVYGDFVEAMNHLAGTHAMSIAGIIRMKAYVEQEILPGKGPGDKLFVGHGSPDGPESFVWQNWEVVGLPARLGGDGHVAGDLGRQWLVMVASLWNDEFRRRSQRPMRLNGSMTPAWLKSTRCETTSFITVPSRQLATLAGVKCFGGSKSGRSFTRERSMLPRYEPSRPSTSRC
jgi:hypothetical protein